MIASVSRRYARALFALAKEQGLLEPIAADLARAAAVAADPGVRQVLRNPLLSAGRRADIAGLIVGQLQPSPLLDSFLRLLADSQRLDELPGIEREYARMLDAALGRIQVTVRTAQPLDAGQQDEIVSTFARITGKQVIPTVVVDPALLGGVVVEAGGRVYDGSVKTHFARIAKELAGAVSL